MRAALVPLLLLGACTSSTPSAGGRGDGGGGEPVDAGADAPACEACEAGTATCWDRTTRAVCNPQGTCRVLRRCPEAEGQPQVCDEATGSCLPRVCDPGAFVECHDAKTSRRCNESGTALVDVACDGCVEGEAAVPCTCQPAGEDGEGGCAPLVCRPGQLTCRGDEEIHQCNEDGTRWVLVDDCNDDAAAICESVEGADGERTARCVPLCEADRKTRSYLGCEYWAVDLDNHMAEGARDWRKMQYAVVVSNASDSGHRAAVRVDTVDGPVWCKPWQDVGPPFEDAPYGRWCWETEDECGTGRRCTTVVDYDRDGEVRAVREQCLDARDGGGECSPRVLVPSGELRVLNLPPRDVLGTTLAPLAYRVTSDVPITAYQFNPLENVQVFSNDASLLLPISALGKHYRVVSREQTWGSIRANLAVVATRPGATDVVVETRARILQGPGIAGLEAGGRRRFTLQQFDVLNLATDCTSNAQDYCREVVDPTGSQVLANRLVAVFGATVGANVPNTNHCEDGRCLDGTACQDNSDCNRNITCCADHLEEQLYPVAAWGRRYVAARSHRRGEPLGTGLEPDVWRVLAAADGTDVVTIPHQASIPTLAAGEWFELESDEDFELQANRAVLLTQFLAAEDAPNPGHHEPGDAMTGDPAMILAVPVEQYREDYVVLAPDKYEHDFLGVVAPAGATVTVDGVPIPAESFEPVADGAFFAARLPVDDGVHRVQGVAGADGIRPKVGVTVYGYDQYVSYGYPGGLNLERVNACASDLDCPRDAFCCLEGMDCADESLGECVGT